MRTNKLMIMVLLFGSSFFVSCMPAVLSYYLPEAEGGTVVTTMCGAGGPKDKIEFSNDGVNISIKSYKIKDGVHFQIVIAIPEGKEVQIRTPLVKAFIPAIENALEVSLIPQVYSDVRPSWEIGDLLAGELVETRWGTHDKEFYMSIKINIPKPESIKLIFPVFYINNRQWNLPEITFKKATWTGILPLNC